MKFHNSWLLREGIYFYYKDNLFFQVKSGGGIEEKGVRFEVRIAGKEDFSRDILKASFLFGVICYIFSINLITF